MTACVLCGAEVTAANPAAYPYCRGCHYSGAAYAQVYAPLLEELRAVGINAVFMHTGGGCWVLEVPLDEQHKRLLWVGWHDLLNREDGDFMVPDTMPTETSWIGAGAYLLDEEGDMSKQAYDFAPSAQGNPADVIRALAEAAQLLTEDDFQQV